MAIAISLTTTGAFAANAAPKKKATPTPTPTYSSTPASSPTPTATAKLTNTSTPAPTSTATAQPTVANTATPTPTKTATPIATVTSTATVTATATSSPTPTVAAGSVIGLGVYRPEFPNNLSVANSLEQASGAKKLPVIAWYALWGGWKSAFSLSDLQTVSNRGSVPLITWEPWAGVSSDPAWALNTAILSGNNDAYINSWAQGMASYGKPVYLRFAHEMHNTTYPWGVGVNGNTAAQYVAAWKHVHDIFAKYNTSNVRWIWNPNTMGASTASTYLPIYQSLYPGDAYVDWVGLDIYNTGSVVNWGAPYWRTFSQVLTEPYNAITALSGKPLMLPEVGSTETGGSKAAWITDAMQTQLPAAFPRVRSLVWFDIKKEADWQLDSSTTSLNAWTTSSQLATFTSNPAALP